MTPLQQEILELIDKYTGQIWSEAIGHAIATEATALLHKHNFPEYHYIVFLDESKQIQMKLIQNDTGELLNES